MPRVAIIPGDGIGVDVTREAVSTFEAACELHGATMELVEWDLGAERYLRDGVAITEDEFRQLADEYQAILLGALGDPRVPDHTHLREILLRLRFGLDLYVNFRPCELLDPQHCPLARVPSDGIRIDIIRENTEGMYVNMGGRFKVGTPDEIAIQEDVNTRKGVERIVRAAFDHARMAGRDKVTLVDKANAMPAAGALWRSTFDDVRAEFGDIETDVMYVDAMVMDLVRRPERYSVLVTSNLFGDIISDLAAEITGGLGMAPSGSIHPGRHALFEPVHGSAPDIAGSGRANPIGAIRSAALMSRHLGEEAVADDIDSAVCSAVAANETTPDLGGDLSTSETGKRSEADWPGPDRTGLCRPAPRRVAPSRPRCRRTAHHGDPTPVTTTPTPVHRTARPRQRPRRPRSEQ